MSDAHEEHSQRKNHGKDEDFKHRRKKNSDTRDEKQVSND